MLQVVYCLTSCLHWMFVVVTFVKQATGTLDVHQKYLESISLYLLDSRQIKNYCNATIQFKIKFYKNVGLRFGCCCC